MEEGLVLSVEGVVEVGCGLQGSTEEEEGVCWLGVGADVQSLG